LGILAVRDNHYPFAALKSDWQPIALTPTAMLPERFGTEKGFVKITHYCHAPEQSARDISQTLEVKDTENKLLSIPFNVSIPVMD